MQLIICEKPKVAEKLAMALGEDGFEKKKIGSVSYYELKRRGEDIVIAPAVGHVYSLHQAVKGSGYPVFDIEWAPAFEVDESAAYTKNYVTNISKLAKKASEFVCACDYDIEGSLIGYNVIRFACGSTKGKRMKFSTLTPDELVEAFDSAGPLDYNNISAGEARHMLDWYYGINLSRALMQAIKKAGIFKVLSIGRVQGPALEILTNREREISGFKPEPYWVLSALISETKFFHEKGRFTELEEAEEAKNNTKKEGTIENIEKKEFTQPPFPPFDLTSLQVEAYKAFGVVPAQTLQLAQALYEAGMISYPRTSSQKLPEKLNLPKIIYALAKQEKYAPIAKQLIEKKLFKPLEGRKTDPAHPAIAPTGLVAQVGERELKLYDLIVRRFLACFAEWAKKESMSVRALLGSERFNASGTRTVEKNWIAFYEPYYKAEEVVLPKFEQGQSIIAEKIKLEEKQTKPPSRFSPASIVETLEKKGLGTKATRAGIIETLQKRGYVEGKSLQVTTFGQAVCEALEHHCPLILDEELTRQIEAEMEEMQEGKLKEEEVVREGRQVLEKILAEFKQKEEEIGKELVGALKQSEDETSILGKCLKCGSDLRSMRSRAGKQFVGCTGYPKCTNAYPLPQFALIKPTGETCEKCKTPFVLVIRKGKKPWKLCLDMNCETKKNWNRSKPAVEKTPANAPSGTSTLSQEGGKTEQASISQQTPESKPQGIQPAEQKTGVQQNSRIETPETKVEQKTAAPPRKPRKKKTETQGKSPLDAQ